jgi:hypothetical protein
MIDNKHKGHQFEKLQKVYQNHLHKIKGEKEVLDDKLGELTSQVLKIDQRHDAINRAKEERVTEINKFIEEAHGKLDAQMKDKAHALVKKRAMFSRDISKFMNIIVLTCI